jgi:hypothetical protein
MSSNMAVDTDVELVPLSLTLLPNGESANSKENRGGKSQAVQPGVQAQGGSTERPARGADQGCGGVAVHSSFHALQMLALARELRHFLQLQR